MEFFSTRNKILSINPNGLRSTSIQLRERIWNVFYKEEYDYYDTLEYTSYTTGIEDMMLEMGIKYEFPANKIYKNQNAEKVEIDYVEKKHVKKPNGAKPGFVVYYTNYSMTISTDITGIREV